MRISILIPVYNEEKTIQNVITDALKKCKDIIVVIDGATDNSLQIVRQFPSINILVNEQNMGLTKTMKRGFEYALNNGYDAVLKIDGDGQMNIEKYDQIINKYKMGNCDVVAAIYNKDTPWMIKKDIWIYSFLFRLTTGTRIRDVISEYRLLNRRAMQSFINSDINDSGSNLSIINLIKDNCRVCEINDGVYYNFVQYRPVYFNILIDCRLQFIKGLWIYNTVWSKFISILSVPILFLLLLFNITVGYRYNSIFPKEKIRI